LPIVEVLSFQAIKVKFLTRHLQSTTTYLSGILKNYGNQFARRNMNLSSIESIKKHPSSGKTMSAHFLSASDIFQP
jgi:hypothetical protein